VTPRLSPKKQSPSLQTTGAERGLLETHASHKLLQINGFVERQVDDVPEKAKEGFQNDHTKLRSIRPF
jgi:hypothetical protein